MPAREIVTPPDPVLSRPAEPVDKIGGAERKLGESMLETMYKFRGIGLAAPQIGVSIRIAVVDLNPPGLGKNPLILINPVIVSREGDISWEEGCLSLPDFRAEIKRSAEIKIRALDPRGRETELTGRNLLAVVIQHELDHLEGKLLIDYVNRIKRNLYLRKLQKMDRESAGKT